MLLLLNYSCILSNLVELVLIEIKISEESTSSIEG